jgi:hypothetical protein
MTQCDPFDEWYEDTQNSEWEIEDDADECVEDDYSTPKE